MTRVTICKSKSGAFVSFTLDGHAGYAQEGTDIVCSAISLLTINTVNSIDLYTDDEIEVTQDAEAGRLSCIFRDTPTAEAELLLKAFALGVTQIEKQYGSDFIEVMIKEV